MVSRRMTVPVPQFSPVPQMGRVLRRPQHTFALVTRPWQIQPFMIAPVLPGETMKNLNLQARVVTDPINSKLIGWWKEYYFFYVKHRDLYDRDLFTQMVLNPEADLSSLDSATSVPFYHTNGTDLAINWAKLCLERVVDEYFRNENEDSTDGLLDGLPSAPAVTNGTNYMDSAINDATVISSDQNLVSTSAGQGDGTVAVKTSEIEKAMRQYEYARMNQLTDMTYEDFLATYGVKPDKEELHKPELLRYLREWQYPSNTIDPNDGTARSAVSWSIAERADKDRFFKEPGFIFGVTVTRPKIYLKGLTSSAVMLMKDAYSWLPAVLSDDPWTSMRKVTAGDPPLDNNTDAYWVDVKDLLLYGDQFINFANTATDANLVALPGAALGSIAKRYAALADAKSLFVDSANDVLTRVREDGVVNLNIAGRQSDTSPQSIGTNYTVRP